MKRSLFVVLLALAALNVFAQEVDLKKEALLARTLQATTFVPNFKQSLLNEKKSTGKATRFMEATLAADNAKLEAIIARVYSRHLSLKQAEELAQFYESAAGKALVTQQARQVSNPGSQTGMEPAHAAKTRAFMNSPTGKTFASISDSEKIWREIAEAIRKGLQKP